MGNQESKPYYKLSEVIPPITQHGWEDNKWTDKGIKCFRNDADRDQFIHSVLSVITSNGRTYLAEHQFKLLFSRRPNDRIVATLVAMKNGVIEAKIEPNQDGKSQADAFTAFKKHVEEKLNDLLEQIPDAGMSKVTAGPSSANVLRKPVPISPVRTRSVSGENGVGQDLPPAYENDTVEHWSSASGDRKG